MSEHVTDFLSATVADKPVAALKAFSAAMEPKIEDSLAQRYAEVSRSVFNPETTTWELDRGQETVEVEEPVAEVEEPEELQTATEEPEDV
jgi:hypothetical protein